MEAFQEDSIGEYKVDEGVIMWVGVNWAHRASIEPQAAIEYAPAMLPLYTGNFKIRFKANLHSSDGNARSYFSPSFTFCISHPATQL